MRIAERFHIWAGLIAGALFCLQGLTGAFLVFEEEIDHALNADSMQLEPGPAPLGLQAQIDALAAALMVPVLVVAGLWARRGRRVMAST